MPKCDRCGRETDWQAMQGQFKRAIERGMSKEDAKALGYHCGKCRTATFKEKGILTPLQEQRRQAKLRQAANEGYWERILREDRPKLFPQEIDKI